MMPLQIRLHPLAALALLALAGSAALVKGEDSDSTKAQLLAGLPSSIPLKHATKVAVHATDAYNKKNGEKHKQYAAEVAQFHQQRHMQVASAMYGQHIYRRPSSTKTLPPKRGSKKPVIVKVPETVIVKTNYQDTTLSFVDPRQQAVAGLRVIATIHRKTPRPGQEEDVVIGDAPNAPLITDAQGHVSLKKIGPLPVAIDIAFADGESKHWQVANADTASLYVPSEGIGPSKEFNGRRIAIYSEESTRAPSTRLAHTPSRLENSVWQESGNPSHLALAGLPGTGAGQRGNATPKTKPQPASTTAKTIYKDVVFSKPDPTAVSIEHNAVDVQVTTQPGSVLTTPAAPGQTWTADAAGIVVCSVPVAALGSGPIPIHVKKDLSGGEAEALINTYKTDPYDRDNAVACDKLHLVKIANLKIADNIAVLDGQAQVEAKVGKADSIKDVANGSQAWEYDRQGLTALMRPSVNPDAAMLCEMLMLTGADAGSVGGIHVGSTQAEAHEALGSPEGTFTSVSGPCENYVQEGMVVCYNNGSVNQIVVKRSTELLKSGTTAFVPRAKARLFVENFTGHDHTGLVSNNDLRGYLSQIHSLEVVDLRENADLTLSASATFKEAKEKLAGSLPFRYECGVDVDYTLTDVEKNQRVGNTRAHADALADYEAEVEDDKPLMEALLNHEDARKILESIDKTAPEEEQAKLRKMKNEERARYRVQHLLDLQNSMHNAVSRCPIIASRKAFGDMVADITRAADFNVRVTGMDYAQGILFLNVGTADGVQVSTEQSPSQFEISVMGQPLPYHEQGLSADYYTAVVTEAGPHSCACQLRHRWRTVEQGTDSEQEAAAVEAAQRIPQPGTGVVSARAWLPNPKLDASLIVAEDPEYGEFVRYIFASDKNKDYRGFQQVFERLIVIPAYGRERYTRNAIFLQPTPNWLVVSQSVQRRGRPTPPLPMGWSAVVRTAAPGKLVSYPSRINRSVVVEGVKARQISIPTAYVNPHPGNTGVKGGYIPGTTTGSTGVRTTPRTGSIPGSAGNNGGGSKPPVTGGTPPGRGTPNSIPNRGGGTVGRDTSPGRGSGQTGRGAPDKTEKPKDPPKKEDKTDKKDEDKPKKKG